MQRTFTTFAALVAGLLAGCAKSDYQLASRERQRLQPVKESSLLNAEEEAMPSIMPQTHFAAGRMFESQGDMNKAVAQYQKAIAQNAQHVGAHHRLGLLLSRMDRHEEAIASFRRAVTLKPDNAILHNNLGFELMYVQKWDEAEAQLRRATELDPTFARAHVNLALLHSRQGRFDESLEIFQQVLHEPDAYYNLGLLHRGQRRYADAAEAFRHVLELRPTSVAARKQLDEVEALIREDTQRSAAHSHKPAHETRPAAQAPAPEAPRIAQAIAIHEIPAVAETSATSIGIHTAPSTPSGAGAPVPNPAFKTDPVAAGDRVTAVVDNEVRCLEERVGKEVVYGNAAPSATIDDGGYRVFRSPYESAAIVDPASLETELTTAAEPGEETPVGEMIAEAPVGEAPYKIEVRAECGDAKPWTRSWSELVAVMDVLPQAETVPSPRQPIGPSANEPSSKPAPVVLVGDRPAPDAPVEPSRPMLVADRMEYPAASESKTQGMTIAEARQSAWDELHAGDEGKPHSSEDRDAPFRESATLTSATDLDELISVVLNEWNCVEALVAGQSRSEMTLGAGSVDAVVTDSVPGSDAGNRQEERFDLRDLATPTDSTPDMRRPESLLAPRHRGAPQLREPLKN